MYVAIKKIKHQGIIKYIYVYLQEKIFEEGRYKPINVAYLGKYFDGFIEELNYILEVEGLKQTKGENKWK